LTRSDFKNLLEQLSEYYGIKRFVNGIRFEMWFKFTEDIPQLALEYIFSKIVEEKDTIPRNLPKVINEYARIWKNSNYKPLNIKISTPCQECGSTGFIWCIRPTMVEGERMVDKTGRYLGEEVSFRCALCENWVRYVHPKAKPPATRQQILEWGYKLLK